jgi:hypothetical protein
LLTGSVLSVPEVLSISGSEDSTSPLMALSHSDIKFSS